MEQLTTTRNALKWGVILGVTSVILSIVTNVFDLWKLPVAGFFSIPIFFVVIFLSLKEYKSETGFLSIGESIGMGAIMGAISGLMNSLFSFIYLTFIDTNFTAKVMDFTREKMLATGQLSEEQIDQALEMGKSWSTPSFTFIFGLFLSILGAFVVSLILSLFLKKEKPIFE